MEKKVEFKKIGLSLSDKQLSLSMNVDPSAAPCVEAVDFYQKSILTESSADNFNNVPFNKGKKRIPKLTTGRVIKPWTCDFNASDVDLSAKEVEVDKFAVMVQLCISDVEDSFLVDRMLAGANNNVNPAEFLSYVWSQIGLQAGEDIETLRWLGDVSLIGSNPFLGQTDGYLVRLETAPALASKIDAVGTLDENNVIAEILKVIGNISPVNRQDSERNKLKIFVSSDVALAFQAKTASSTAMGAYITNTGDMFLGRFQLIETPMLPNRTMVASPKQDLVYTYDLLNDKDNFITVDRRQYAAEEYIRFRVNAYFGFDVFDYTNVVFYRPATNPDLYSLTITVEESVGSTPVIGAGVTIGGVTKFTNASGVVVYTDMPDATYSIDIIATGYVALTGSATVAGSNTTATLQVVSL